MTGWTSLIPNINMIMEYLPSYGLNENVQNELLDKMTEFIKSMRVRGKRSLLPFQKGNNIQTFHSI